MRICSAVIQPTFLVSHSSARTTRGSAASGCGVVRSRCATVWAEAAIANRIQESGPTFTGSGYAISALGRPSVLVLLGRASLRQTLPGVNRMRSACGAGRIGLAPRGFAAVGKDLLLGKDAGGLLRRVEDAIHQLFRGWNAALLQPV